MTMTRGTMDGLPIRAPLPPGIRLRTLTGLDEAEKWTRLQKSAEPFMTIADDLFVREFGGDADEISVRCFFAVDTETGAVVGTASAWHGGDKDARGRDWGRLHWVAVHPDYQRRGIARALVTQCLHRMAELGHARAYLVTSSGRTGAIALYESVGFATDPLPPP